MKKRMLLVVFCMILLVILVGCSLEDFESNSEVTPVSALMCVWLCMGLSNM